MGLTYIQGDVVGPSGERASLQFLVDSGSNYSLLPNHIWKKLQIKPVDAHECILVDGTRIKRQVGDCAISVAGKSGYARVVLGEPGDDEALLGAITLEGLGLVLDPFRRELKAMHIRL